MAVVCLSVWSLGFAGIGPPPPLPTTFTIIEIEPMGNDDQSRARGVNENGLVVGQTIDTVASEIRGMIYNLETGGRSNLSSLLDSPVFTGGRAINSSGLIAVNSLEALPFFSASINYVNFIVPVDPAEAMGVTFLDDIGPSSVACGYASDGGNLVAIKVVNGATAPIGALPGFNNSRAFGINGGNAVVGICWNGAIQLGSGFVYTSDFTPLTTLGGTFSQPHAINGDSKIAGHSYTGVGDQFHATIWEDPTTPVGYGALPGADNSTFLNINFYGDAVGWSESDGSEDHRAIIRPGGSGDIIDLNTFVPAGSGWVLREAWDISSNRYIVGDGELNGEVRGFLMIPFPPETVMAYFDFAGEGSALGWTTLVGIPGFETPLMGSGASGLSLSPNNNFNAFGIYQSPNINIMSDGHYRASFVITTDQINAEIVPQFRLRVGQQDNNAAWVANIDSTNFYAPPMGISRQYSFDFLPEVEPGGSDFYLAVDITHFNPGDTSAATIFVEQAWLEIIPGNSGFKPAAKLP